MLRNGREILSLKQFMLRSEVLKLYRNYMKLGRLIEQLNGKGTDVGIKLKCEWTNWVRDEFKLRKNESDEAIIKMLISQGKRQMDELERSIRIANG